VSNRFEEIARRKQLLIDRCATERQELAGTCQRMRVPLSLSAVLLALGAALRSHPILVAGISSLLAGGYGGKLANSAGSLLRLGKAILPLWWLIRRKGK
jgi:hypothetical protein